MASGGKGSVNSMLMIFDLVNMIQLAYFYKSFRALAAPGKLSRDLFNRR